LNGRITAVLSTPFSSIRISIHRLNSIVWRKF
jgi:hypothetical protein